MKHNILTQHHAHLWVSDTATLQQEITRHLQELFCKHNQCRTCTTCTIIEQQQHPWICHINPEGSYNLEDIDPVMDNIKFKLDQSEYRFFIFHHAQDLTPACSNRLLKTIEEPHARYHFVFLATRTDTILSTIISRCFFKEFAQQHAHDEYQEIIHTFINQDFSQPHQFLKNIDKLDIKEQASKDIIDALITHVHKKLVQLHQSPSPDTASMMRYMQHLIILKQQLAQLPVQGSSKIFWKNLFLTFHANQK